MRACIALLFFLAGCVDEDPPAARILVTVISTQEGQPVEDATRSLVAYGRRALVVIEAGMHTAPAPGRRRLVRAIRRLGDADGIALLRHIARFDEDDTVRAEATTTLEQWAADRSDPLRADAAKQALRFVPSAPSP